MIQLDFPDFFLLLIELNSAVVWILKCHLRWRLHMAAYRSSLVEHFQSINKEIQRKITPFWPPISPGIRQVCVCMCMADFTNRWKIRKKTSFISGWLWKQMEKIGIGPVCFYSFMFDCTIFLLFISIFTLYWCSSMTLFTCLLQCFTLCFAEPLLTPESKHKHNLFFFKKSKYMTTVTWLTS